MPESTTPGAATVDVAIVGSGFSGVACAVQCSWALPADRRIALVGMQAPGRGAAYGTTSARLLMNGPARDMSAIPQEKMDLVKRARVTEHALIPRRDYSTYLQTLLNEALARHSGLAVYEDEILDIERDGDGFLLRAASGATRRARSVILALGNPAPSSSFLPTPLREHARFVADPWDVETLPDGDVLCIGTGLTAMDIIALADRPGKSHVHLVSRHGRLPEIEDPYAHAVDPLPFALDDSSPRTFVRTLRAAVAQYVDDGGDWRDVLETIRPLSPGIWSRWDMAERRRFLRHLAPVWGPLRYRVPPETFAAFARMRGAARITVHRGHVSAVRAFDDESIAIEIADGSARQVVTVGSVVNCTGPDDDVTHSRSPLIAALLRRGLIRSHPLHIGIDAGDDLRPIAADGSTGAMFALGPILRGAFYETTAISEIRDQALRIAQTLASSRPSTGSG